MSLTLTFLSSHVLLDLLLHNLVGRNLELEQNVIPILGLHLCYTVFNIGNLNCNKGCLIFFTDLFIFFAQLTSDDKFKYLIKNVSLRIKHVSVHNQKFILVPGLRIFVFIF